MNDFEIVGTLHINDDGTATLQMASDKIDQMKDKSESLSSATEGLGRVWDFVWGELIVKGIEEATKALVEFGSQVIDEAKEAQVVQGQLNAVLTSTHGIAGMTADAINNFSTKMANLTGFTEEQITSGQTMLLQFTNIGKDVFPQASQAALDLARRTGTDLTSAFQMVGKALGMPEEGIGRLNTAYRLFDQAQMEHIKLLAMGGKTAEAQQYILDALSKKVGGAALAYGQTFAGQMDILSARFDEMKESLGTPIIMALSGFTGKLLESGGAIDQISTIVEHFAGGRGLLAVREALLGLGFTSQDVGSFFLRFNEISKGVGVTLGQIGDWFNTNGPGLAQAGAQIAGALGEAFQKIGAQAGPFLLDTFGKIGAWFNDNGPRMVQVAQAIADVFTNNVVPAIIALWPAIQGALGGIIDLMLGISTAIWKIATGDWQGAWDTMVSTVQTVGAAIPGIISSFIDAVAHLVGSSLAETSQVWSNNWNMFVNIVTVVGQQIAASVLAWLATLVLGVSTGIGSMVASVQAGISGVAAKISSEITKWVTVIKNAVGGFISAGKALVDGLAKGLTDGLTKLLKTVKDMVSAILAEMAKVAGIHSPSKMTEQFGVYLTEGLALGMMKGIPKALGAINDMMPPLRAQVFATGMAGGGNSTAYNNNSFGGETSNHFYYGPVITGQQQSGQNTLGGLRSG